MAAMKLAGRIRTDVAAALLVATSVLVQAALAQSGSMQSIRYGEVTGVSPTTVVDRSTGTGARVGATVGSVAGYALAGGRDRWLGSLVGGAIGGAAGNAAENSGRKKKGWQLVVKLENGEEIGVQVVGKKQQHQVGDRVRLLVGAGGQVTAEVVERAQAPAAPAAAASSAPPASTGAPAEGLSIRYQAHVGKQGWQEWVADGELAGTVGERRRVEALQIEVTGDLAGAGLRYRAHVGGVGWMDWVRAGELSGTTNQKRAVEAFEIELVRAPAGLHVRYQAHVEKQGWHDWVQDGQTAGTTGQGLQVEALRIELVRD
jgi:outer membrane lipoprotein SlyB